jgi:hypothetical protein
VLRSLHSHRKKSKNIIGCSKILFCRTLFFGAFRCGNKTPSSTGGRIKKALAKENLHDIIVNGLATALLNKISWRFYYGKGYKK